MVKNVVKEAKKKGWRWWCNEHDGVGMGEWEWWRNGGSRVRMMVVFNEWRNFF